MKFSIVTAVLNGVGTLEDTLRSVARERGSVEVEHIVVDGGSTDGTLELLRRFGGDLRWSSGPDGGISAAFNKGIRAATGDVVGIISADDELWPGALRQVRRAAQADPDADVIFGDAVFEEADGERVLVRPETGFEHVLERTPLRHAAVFVRRSAYERFGLFDEGLRFTMDYELILRLHTGGARFVYVPEPLALIRAGGASARNFRAALREAREISIRYGASPLRAWRVEREQLLKTHLRDLLGRPGLRWVLKAYRARSGRFGRVQHGSGHERGDGRAV